PVPLYMHSAHPAQDRTLAGYIAWGRNSGANQPLCKAGIQTAGHRVLVTTGCEGAHLELSFRPVLDGIPWSNKANAQPAKNRVVGRDRQHLISGTYQHRQPARTVVDPVRRDDRIRSQTQPFDNPRQDIRLQRSGAAQFRRGKSETANAATD